MEEILNENDTPSEEEETEPSAEDIAVQAFWDYITKVANGEKLNRMILWQLTENYPQGNYDFSGRAIDNNSQPEEEFGPNQ